MTNETAPKRKPGRPRKPTADLETALYQGISEGLTVRAACAKAGISYSAVSVRCASDPEFRDSLARAYLHGSIFSLDDAEHRLRTATPKNISVAREVAHHARWRTSKLVPAYRDKVSVDVNATVSSPLWAWQHKKREEWTHDDRMNALRCQMHNLHKFANAVEDMGLPDVAAALVATYHATWDAVIAKIQAGDSPATPRPPLALPAPVEPAERVINPFPGDVDYEEF